MPKIRRGDMTGSKSPTILNTVNDTPTNLRDMAGWSCAAGKIEDLDSNKLKMFGRKRLVNEFLGGASYSYGAVIGHPMLGVGFNRVHPIVNRTSNIYGSHANEIVVGSSGVNMEIGVTIEVSK